MPATTGTYITGTNCVNCPVASGTTCAFAANHEVCDTLSTAVAGDTVIDFLTYIAVARSEGNPGQCRLAALHSRPDWPAALRITC